jgi:hypothetical protein
MRRPLALALAAVFAAPLAAQQQHAHVHGLAHADIAVDGGKVEITLRATAYDLVGFERAARDEAEVAAINAARALMLDHARLWRFNVAAGCVAEAPVLEVPAATGSGHGHDDHGHGHEGHDHDHGGHVDWLARYRFDCARPDALRAIDVALFEAVPALQTLKVQLIDGAGARALELTPVQARIALGSAP